MKKAILPGLIVVTISTAIVAYVFAQPSAASRAGGGPAEARAPRPAVENLTAPDAQERANARRLVRALNTGDTADATTVLRSSGLASDTVQAMEGQLALAPKRASLAEPFLKATVALSLAGEATNVQARVQAATLLGYERPVWIARWLDTNWAARCDAELGRCSVEPIAVLNVRLDDPNFLRFIQWYDRYADQLHSVVLNGEELTNAKLDQDYDQANRTLNALYQLIKARKPDAFVWLSVVKQEDRSDERWLRAMTFKPDGLQISNLRQFHSPFAETRRRYVAIVGEDTPMMVAGFYGYKEALQAKGKALSSAKKIENLNAREQSVAGVKAELGGIGAAVGQDLERQEALLQSLGYRGLSAHLLLIEAIANQDRAVPVEKSELIDPRVGWLDTYYAAKDFKSMSALTAVMLSESAPGDMNWTVAKLYDGIVLLSQTPPETARAAAVLDEVLTFDYTGRPGRDHYVLGAATWRMYAAELAGDKVKPKQLLQWVENKDFRQDLKKAFLKQSKDAQVPATTPSK